MLIYRDKNGEIEPRDGIVVYRYGVDMLIKQERTAFGYIMISDPYDATVYQQYGHPVDINAAMWDYIHRYKNGLLDKTVIVE